MMNNTKLRYLNEYITQKDPKEDYKVLKSIGSGTYGQVYKAINKHTNVYAAVKLIKIEMNDNVKSIVREIHILRSCSHPNIVNYFGSYLRKDRLWICMEFCGGFSMQDIYITIRRPLDENCIAFVTRETLQGLAYMHSKGKIHRDIKGANILLTDQGQVKIADFGISAQISETIQKRMSFIGTPYWMAPEVAGVARTGGYDEKCDIWSVGITSMEYAELQPPMFELHPMKALRSLSSRNYKSPVLKNQYKWSSKFHAFLRSALNTNDKKRPDALVLLKHEFVTQKSLSITLTKNLLHIRQNPGFVPMVLNDEDDEKPLFRPPEKIQSKKRDDQHSHIEELKLKIKKQPKVPFVDVESSSTSESDDSESDDSQDRKDTLAPIATRNDKSGSSNSDDKRNELSEPSQKSAKDAPELPPKKSKQPPPIPPLPVSRRTVLVREFQTRPIETAFHETRRRNSSVELKDLLEITSEKPERARRFSNVDGTNQKARPIVHAPKPQELTPPTLPIKNDVWLNNSDDVKPTPFELKVENDVTIPEDERDSSSNINHLPSVGMVFSSATQDTIGVYFSLIFQGSPLKINATATWINPITHAEIILFGSTIGIYYLSREELADSALTKLFPQSCTWLHVVQDTMMSICGERCQLYNHNLLHLFKLKSYNEKSGKRRNFVTIRLAPTTKVLNADGCCWANVSHNSSTGARHLCVTMTNEILVMEWFDPISTFMELKRITINNLDTYLVNFELLFDSKPLPVICLGVYPGDTTVDYRFHLLDLNEYSEDNGSQYIPSNNICENRLDVVKLIQLDLKTLIIAFRDTVVITNLEGHLMKSKKKDLVLKFNFVIQSIVCLSESVLVFHQHGLVHQNFHGEMIQEINDPTHVYHLIGWEKNIVLEKKSIDEHIDDSNLYLLSVHTESS